MSNVIIRDQNDPWACYVRACAKVANTTPGTEMYQMAMNYKNACWKAYTLSDQFPFKKVKFGYPRKEDKPHGEDGEDGEDCWL